MKALAGPNTRLRGLQALPPLPLRGLSGLPPSGLQLLPTAPLASIARRPRIPARPSQRFLVSSPPSPRERPHPPSPAAIPLAEAAALASPRVSTDRIRAKPPGCGAPWGSFGHSPLGCPLQPPHLARRLLRAPANHTVPLSLERAPAQYVAGRGRRGAGARKKILSFRLASQ